MADFSMTGTKTLDSVYDPTKLNLAMPNYGAPLVGPMGYTATGAGQVDLSGQPINQGFTTLDPVTGKPKMLGTTRTDPTNLAGLIGAPKGSVGGLPGFFPGVTRGPAPGGVAPAGGGGGIPGAAGGGMPIDASGGGTGVPGGNPSAITGPGGANPTPGPNPLPGVDPSGQLPSYLLNQFGGNLASELKGELPQDVQNMLQQQAAEYGVGSGTQGSQFQGYRGLRNLGLTSLDLQKHAEDLLAGQFTKASDKIALDQSAQKIKDLEDQWKQSFGLEKQKLEAELKLEKDKFAAQQNQLQHSNQINDLEALGLKYGGGSGGGGGGLASNYLGTFGTQQPFFNWSTGTTSYY